jgi:AraC-like DNA-binding protein
VQSAVPRPELIPFVRAYAQRQVFIEDPSVIEHVPAQLEQVMNFELRAFPKIVYSQIDVSAPVLVGGSQTGFSGELHLRPGVESFAIFFTPSGWSRLFRVPMTEMTNRFLDASLIHGNPIVDLWNQLADANSFEIRIALVEAFLLQQLARSLPEDKVAAATAYLFRQRGAVRLPRLGRQASLSLRQFERLFRSQVGMSPKRFARIARFLGAVDCKLKNPDRSWLEVAHALGYYDQMHMVHDFENLGRNTPTQLLVNMGDVRPTALFNSQQ